MDDKYVKIGGLLVVTISVPTALSVLLFNVIPSLSHLVLFVLVALSAIHPALGIQPLVKVLELEEAAAVKPVAQQPVEEPSQPSLSQSFTKPDAYIDQLPELRQKMLEFGDLEKQPADNNPESLWRVLLTQRRGDFEVTVHKRVNTEFFFRVVADFEGSPEEMFDLLADVEKRPEWDELTVKSGIVERISNRTVIQFLHSKGFWPTAPRDALVLSINERLPDGRYMNVTKSIDSHPNYQSPAGSVRMIAKLTGTIAGPHPSGNPKLSRCIQLIDGDLCGWLPASLVSMVSTQAFPISMRRANSRLKKIPNHTTVSRLIERAESQTEVVVEPKAPNEHPIVQKQVKDKASTLAYLLRIVEKSQPWVVLAILAILLFRKK